MVLDPAFHAVDTLSPIHPGEILDRINELSHPRVA